MTRLAATIQTDLRLQLRNGFYLATLLVLIISIGLVRALPRDVAAVFLPVVIIGNVLVNAFYFVSGLLLLERTEGTILAQAVTPLRPGEYLAAKVVTLTLLSVCESAILAVAAFGVHVWLAPLVLGIALAAVLFCLVGVALVMRHPSINEFLLPSVLYSAGLCLPLLGIFGVGSPAWYWLHPLGGVIRLMQLDQPPTVPTLIYSVAYPLLWIAPLYVWSRRALAAAQTS